jgi:hypothetical protein
MLGKQEAASMRVNLDATAALSRLAAPHRGLCNRVYFAYYYWHVLYTHINGTVILPVGYPKVRPVPFNSRDER